MEEIVGQVKWSTPNHIKGQSSSKEGDIVYVVVLEGSPLLREYLQENRMIIPTSTVPH